MQIGGRKTEDGRWMMDGLAVDWRNDGRIGVSAYRGHQTGWVEEGARK